MDLIRPARVEGNKSGEGFVFGHQPPPVAALLPENHAVKAPPVRAPVGPRGRKLPFEARRNVGEGVNLPVGVRHGHADHLPLVLENQDVADARRLLQLDEPLSPKPDELGQVFEGKLGQGSIVVRVVQDHVALAVGRRHAVEIIAFDRRLGRRDGQRREIVRIDVNVVVLRHASRPGAERAPAGRHEGTVLPVGSGRDPFPNGRIPAEFRHGRF